VVVGNGQHPNSGSLRIRWLRPRVSVNAATSGYGAKLPIRNVRHLVATGGKPDMARTAQSVAIDPSATLAVHCGNGFDTDFGPYQSTRFTH
jgi:hypothetical protein